MNIKLLLLILFFFINIVVLRILIKNKDVLVVSFSAVFAALYYFLYLPFDISIFLIMLSLQTILLVLSVEDAKHQYLLTWHFVVLFLNVLLLRFFLNLPVCVNLFSPLTAAALLGLPYLITKGKGIGIGDPIVLMILSVVLTPVGVFVVFLITVVAALIFGVLKKRFTNQKTTFALVPFIHFAFFLYFPLKSGILHLIFLDRLYQYQWIGGL